MRIEVDSDGRRWYVRDSAFVYRSERYGKSITVPAEYRSDGATGGTDILSEAWWVHDVACDTGQWDDGTPITNWQASRVLGDILMSERRPFRAVGWMLVTFLFGGGEARRNGMVSIRKCGTQEGD